MVAWFKFRGISNTDMNLKLLEMDLPQSAEEESEIITIPGRIKPVIKRKKQYKPLTSKIVLEVKKCADIRAVFAWLRGSGELITSDEPDKCYIAHSLKPVSGKRENGIYRKITVQYTVEPQAYSVSEKNIPISTTYTVVENSGTAETCPPIITLKVTADDAPILMGDVNFDGTVDATDASLVMSEYTTTATGGEGTFTDEQKIAADMNSDGTVDASDASTILDVYMENQTSGGSSSIGAEIEKQVTITTNGEDMIIGLPAAVVRTGATVTIDSENYLLYYTDANGKKVNILNLSSGGFPMLHEGTNYIKFTGDVDEAIISYRERWL